MYLESLNVVQANPADPSGTTNASGLMQGLAGSIKIQGSGRILILVSGTVFNAGIGQGANLQIRFGTGAAPANAGALAGTAIGGLVKYISATIAEKGPFAVQAATAGLVVGTTYWVDLSLAATTAGTATLSDISLTIVEL